MEQPIAVCMLCAVLLAGAPIAAPGSRAQAKKPQGETGRSEKLTHANPKPSRPELVCIVRMLKASTPAEAKARKAMCKDSFLLRAYYASLLVQLHAAGADDVIIRNLPQNLADLHAFYNAPDIFYADDYANYSDSGILVHAYERYYKSLFRIVTERPALLPKFFPIADRFGAPIWDNVDESGWFSDELHQIYEKIPAAYMRAVHQTKNKEYRDFARACALHPVP